MLEASRPADRDKFLAGLEWLNRRCAALFGRDINAATATDLTALLSRVSDEQPTCREEPIGCEFFKAIKAMTIAGYYYDRDRPSPGVGR